MNVSCVIPTRGDCDLSPILDSLSWCNDVIVADNSRSTDLGIYARYAAIDLAKHDVIVAQDDDVIVTCWPEILDAYEPGVLTVNYPEPYDIPWVGCGAIFDRGLPAKMFARYAERFPLDVHFTHRMCDGVFALLAETKVIDCGYRDLPHGLDEGRVSSSPGWYDSARPLIQRRVAALATGG